MTEQLHAKWVVDLLEFLELEEIDELEGMSECCYSVAVDGRRVQT